MSKQRNSKKKKVLRLQQLALQKKINRNIDFYNFVEEPTTKQLFLEDILKLQVEYLKKFYKDPTGEPENRTFNVLLD